MLIGRGSAHACVQQHDQHKQACGGQNSTVAQDNDCPAKFFVRFFEHVFEVHEFPGAKV